MILYLHDDLKKHFSSAEPLFDQLMALRGECFRHQKGRLTQRVRIGHKSYFIKQHTGVGWREIFKNIVQLRWPVVSAKNEWLAIEKLKMLGIAVPIVVGFGERGKNPAHRESFILMEELTPTVSLEHLCQGWRQSPPTFAEKRGLLKQVAVIASTMHENGINHRDFYICHFLQDLIKTVAKPKLYLIDLHRAQLRQRVPERWVIKDLAGLYFSSLEALRDGGIVDLTQRDCYRFMRDYRQKRLRDIFRKEKTFWEKVKARGEQLYRDHSK